MREAAPTCSDSLCDNSSCVLDDSKIGSADMDIIEMGIYDKYRKLDGHEYPHMYLKKCRNKLIAKVKQCRENIHNLEIELAQTKWKSALEKERIRKFYDIISFGQSRSGKLVSLARGTSAAAAEIIADMKKMYSIGLEQYYNWKKRRKI